MDIQRLEGAQFFGPEEPESGSASAGDARLSSPGNQEPVQLSNVSSPHLFAALASSGHTEPEPSTGPQAQEGSAAQRLDARLESTLLKQVMLGRVAAQLETPDASILAVTNATTKADGAYDPVVRGLGLITMAGFAASESFFCLKNGTGNLADFGG